jgi:hypothetical protein
MIRVCSHQPSFLPWVGFWNKLAQCDLYVALCGVPFATHDYQNRVKLAGSWLTLPLDKSTRHLPLYQVKVRDTKAAAISLEKTLHCKRYPYYDRIAPIVEFLKLPTNDLWPDLSLTTINLQTMKLVRDLLGLKYEIKVDFEPGSGQFSKTQNVMNAVGDAVESVQQGLFYKGVTYYAGSGALAYLNRTQIGKHVQVLVQGMKPGLQEETILQSIAREPDPADYVMNAATWRPL